MTTPASHRIVHQGNGAPPRRGTASPATGRRLCSTNSLRTATGPALGNVNSSLHRHTPTGVDRGDLVATVAPWFEDAYVPRWSAWHVGILLEPPTSWRAALSAIGPALTGQRGAR